tara:strand:- start:137 stop:802 length:666 start_codon:yes stop_codon:yes gene_type:complete
MIPKSIHQVFWNFKGKELHEIPVFKKNVGRTKQFCKEHNYQYKMWSLKDCEELIVEKYPEYICLWSEFRFDIQRCDFIRYLILHQYGGWYVDCDAYPIQNLESISNHREVFSVFNDDKKRHPCNAEMGSVFQNELFIKISDEVEKRVIEKQAIKQYDAWKGRLVFQTTGHWMLASVVPKTSLHDILLVHNEKKKLYTTSPNPYFYENCVSLWYDGWDAWAK